jgi:DNA-binding response OmpR family regulator
MRPVSAVVVHKDPSQAENLADALRQHFRFVCTVSSPDAARVQVQQHKAQLIVVDLETTSLKELRALCEACSTTTIVCTHRLADERLWLEALGAGATDCCRESDVRAIVLAAFRHMGITTRTAVA